MRELSKKFATERSKYLRTTELSKMDEWTIDQIEEHGCALISVGRNCTDDFVWTYSLGIYDTCGQPELITVGLPFEVAKSCLNETARRMRDGVDVTKEPQKELIENVDCELRVVSPEWVKRLMNFANWFNGGADYPVLQVIYPDLQNRFQWEENFESRFIQPLLQPGIARTPVDQQFWDSIGEDEERFPGWKFPDKPHTKAFISKAIQEETEWITYVTHDLSDGAWQILGETGMKAANRSWPACTTWLRKIRLWRNSPISRKDGTRRERCRESHGSGSRKSPSRRKLTNEPMRRQTRVAIQSPSIRKLPLEQQT